MGYIRNPYTNVPKEIATYIDELKGVIQCFNRWRPFKRPHKSDILIAENSRGYIHMIMPKQLVSHKKVHGYVLTHYYIGRNGRFVEVGDISSIYPTCDECINYMNSMIAKPM